MAKGLPKSYIKKYGITKKAWKKYRKAQSTTKKSRAKHISTSKPKRRVGRTVARKKSRKTRRKPRYRIPIAASIGMLSPFIIPAPSKRTLIGDLASGNLDNLGYDAREIFTGVGSEGKFRLRWIGKTYGLMIGLTAISMLASKLGLNRWSRGLPVRI